MGFQLHEEVLLQMALESWDITASVLNRSLEPRQNHRCFTHCFRGYTVDTHHDSHWGVTIITDDAHKNTIVIMGAWFEMLIDKDMF